MHQFKLIKTRTLLATKDGIVHGPTKSVQAIDAYEAATLRPDGAGVWLIFNQYGVCLGQVDTQGEVWIY